MNPISAEVTIDRGASEAELKGVAEAFRQVGVEAAVRAGYGQKSAFPPWMVMASLPVTGFLTALAAEAGKDAYKQIKRLIKHLRAARATSKQPAGNIVLQDTETKIQLVLSDDPPDQALEALFQLDIGSLPGGPVSYDAERREWMSFTIEWGRKRVIPREDGGTSEQS